MDEADSALAFPAEIVMVKMQQPPKRQLHFFYERTDGSIVDLSEQEAAISYKHSQKFRFWRQVGVSDGSALIEYLKNCGVRPGQQIPYTQAQEIMRAAFAAELEAARGKFQHPRLAEWAYPDNSVPQNERQAVALPTNE